MHGISRNYITTEKHGIRFRVILFISVIFCVALWVSVAKARAQDVLPLTATPAHQEIALDPGEKTAINVKFLNRGDTPVSGILKVVDFIIKDKEGSPLFLEDWEGTPTITGTTQISPRFSAASWVSLPYDRITIAPKDKVLINAKIVAPPDARPGGRYVAIYFETGAIPGEAIGVAREAVTPTIARIVSLVYVRVSGPITEDAYVVQFTAPRFSEYGPVLITTEILNRGDYHIQPKGTITLTSIFGKKVDQQLLNEENIFPDASRIFENKLGEKWMFGKYKLELTAAYGETGKALTATLFTWVFPWKIISAVILAVIITILIVALLYHRFKKREEKLEEKVEELEEKLEEKS